MFEQCSLCQTLYGWTLRRWAIAALSRLGTAALLCGAALFDVAVADTVPPAEERILAEGGASSYVRISRDESRDPISLDTSIVRLTKEDATGSSSVDLVSAVHIGEASYYEALNRRFESYDAVLFELVAESDVHQSGQIKGDSSHPISALQQSLKNWLKLEFQLDAIDYGAKNFVHADMTPAQLSGAMVRRGESFFTLMLRAVSASAARESQGGGRPPDLSSMFLLLFDESRAIALRRIIASEFEGVDDLLATINGPEGSAILTDRNTVALTVLEKAMAQGKRKIAIFYGGAHMPDIETRMITDRGFTKSGIEWLVAWRLRH
jgi:hypothetical protein